jgi:hypothetical protein
MIKLFSLKKAALLTLFTAIGSFNVANVSAQQASRGGASIWQPVAEENIASRGQRYLQPEQYRTFRLNQTELANVLSSAPLEFSEQSKGAPVILTVPAPDGKLVRFRVEESPILAPDVAAQFPTWKTYQGYGIDDPTLTARFDWTDRGFHGYVLDPVGTYSIDPYQAHDIENYIVFRKNEFGNPPRNFHCGLDELLSQEKVPLGPIVSAPLFTHGTQIRTYRLAVATNFRIHQLLPAAGRHGSASADARLESGSDQRQPHRRGLSQGTGGKLHARFRHKPDVCHESGASSRLRKQWFERRSELEPDERNAAVGITNYDVGHLFETGDGGVAQLSSVCGASKARGLSGLPNPTGDPFDVDYVAHELGHQFGGNHTFNASSNCGSSPIAPAKSQAARSRLWVTQASATVSPTCNATRSTPSTSTISRKSSTS